MNEPTFNFLRGLKQTRPETSYIDRDGVQAYIYIDRDGVQVSLELSFYSGCMCQNPAFGGTRVFKLGNHRERRCLLEAVNRNGTWPGTVGRSPRAMLVLKTTRAAT